MAHRHYRQSRRYSSNNYTAPIALDDSDRNEYIYLLVNEYVPRLVKIGFTTRHPDVRAREISIGTGVPGTWCVRYSWKVDYGYDLEQYIFSKLKEYRLPYSEMFELQPDEAKHHIDTYLEISADESEFDRPRFEQAKRDKQAEEKRRVDLRETIRCKVSNLSGAKTKHIERRKNIADGAGLITPAFIAIYMVSDREFNMVTVFMFCVVYAIALLILNVSLYKLISNVIEFSARNDREHVAIRRFLEEKYKISELDQMELEDLEITNDEVTQELQQPTK